MLEGVTLNARVNLLCVAGAALGLVVLFVPLLEVSGEGEYVLSEILQQSQLYGTGFALGVTLFLLGAVIAFLTPAGGFLELVGVMTYLYLVPQAYQDFDGKASPALGTYLAIGSTVVVIVSLIVPLGLGYPKRNRLWNEMLGIAARFLTISTHSASAKLRINLLCIVGASLAFISIALPWIETTDIWYAGNLSAKSSESLFGYGEELGFGIACIIFVVGSAVAFVTPTASLAQLISLWWIYAVSSSHLEFAANSYGLHEVALGLGFYVALIGGTMVAFSLFFPIGTGFFGRRNGLGGHLIVWGTPGKPRGIPFRTLVS